jgi:hypothetical protein
MALLRRAVLVSGWTVVSACASPTNDGTTGSDAAEAGTSSVAGSAGRVGASGAGSGASGAAGSGVSSGGASASGGSAGTAGGTGGAGEANAGGAGAVSIGGASGLAGTGGASGGSSKAGSGGSAGMNGSAGSAGRGGASGVGGAGGAVATGGGGAGGKAGAANGGTGGTCEQTITLIASADTNINAASPTANYGPVAEVNIVRGGSASSERALFSFDLSSLPSGATLKSAQLELTIVNNPGLDKTIAVHRIAQASNRAWVESQVTWREYKTGSSWIAAGGDFAATPTDSEPVSGSAPANSVVTFQVLSDAQSFYTTPSTNFGWLIKDTQEPATSSGEHVFFATRENATADYAPKLVLSYCP